MIEAPPVIRRSRRHHASQVIRQWIDRGILVGGQPVPSERALSDSVGVSRTVVREVIRSFVEEGLIVENEAGKYHVRVSGGGTEAGHMAVLASTIAILTPHIESYKGHEQPGWSDHVTQGAMRGARDSGRDVLAIHPDRLLDGGLKRLLAVSPLGVIVPEPDRPVQDQEPRLRQIRSSGIPVVVFGDAPQLADFDRVMSDHEQGSYDLTRWLISRGCKRMLNFWGRPDNHYSYWYASRRRGYERAIKEAGLEVLPTVIFTPFPPTADQDAKDEFDIKVHQFVGHLSSWMSGNEPVDAIMMSNDSEIPAATSAVRMMGKESGRDVFLAGYDNHWAGSDERAWEATPPAVTVDKHNFEMGQEMVRLLLDRVAGRLPEGPQCRKVKSKLVFFDGVNADGV